MDVLLKPDTINEQQTGLTSGCHNVINDLADRDSDKSDKSYCLCHPLLLLLLIIVVVIYYCCCYWLLLSLLYRCLVSPIILIASMFIWVEVISVFWSQVIWSKMISCLGGIRRDHPESSRSGKGRWKENDLWLLVKPISRLSSLVHRSSSILLFLARQFCRGRSSRRCNVQCND